MGNKAELHYKGKVYELPIVTGIELPNASLSSPSFGTILYSEKINEIKHII